jgi:MFS family permease
MTETLAVRRRVRDGVRMTSVEQPRATYRQVFAVREFRALLAGFAVFLVSETVQMLALSVLIYASTGSPLLAALAYVAGFLPQAFGGTVLLAVADRWRPRRILLGFDALRLTVAVLLASGSLPPLVMVLLVFVVGGVAPIANASRTALLPELLHGDEYVLGRSLFTVTSAGTQVLGAAVGGVLLLTLGPVGALWLAAAGCVLSAAVNRFGLADRPARTIGGPGAVRQTWQVNRQLLADPAVRGLLLAQWLPGVLMVAAEGVVVPYSGSAAGFLLASAAGGMLIGEFVVGRFLSPRLRERLTPWLALLLGVPLLVFVLEPGVVAAAIVLAVAAAGFAYHLGLARRFLDAVPEAHRGQAFGLATTGTMTFQGLSMAAAGGLAEVLRPGTVMALAGAASVLATITLWRRLAGP